VPPRAAPVHYLRPNDKVWTPPAVVFLDTETRIKPGSDPETLTLRLWDAHYLDRRTKAPTPVRDEWGSGNTAAELVSWLDRVTRNRETVWLYAHNLSFDLVTTRLPMLMVAAGWHVTDAAVGGKAPWLRLVRGKRHLTMADSWSWLPVALEAVGAAVRLAKPELPEDDDSDEAWHVRCRGDVMVLERAVLDLMDWWDANSLGRWTISGAACGWNAYRHTKSMVPVVIDPDPDKVKSDRAAYHGGRRGTWVIGEHHAGPFVELDFRAAYPTVAAHLPLPIGRSRTFDSMELTDPLIGSERWGVAARCLVDTDRARWPVKVGKRTWYPVGRFWTDLAGPDIAEARRLGCLVKIGPGQVHRLGHAMQPWARWVLAIQEGLVPGTPEVAKLAAKSWGRAVIGKWAARGFDRVKLGPSPGLDWHYEEAWNHSEQAHAGILDFCGQRWQITASGTPDNAYPAVPAWVESEVRVRLNRVIDALGPGALIQCDTDGMIVALRTVGTPAAHGNLVAPDGLGPMARLHWCLDQLEPVYSPLELRIKRTVTHVTVLGPQHLTVDGRRRYAGLPGTAVEESPGEYRVKLWPKLQWQLTNGSREGYVRPESRPIVKGPWPTGWVLADNTVVPVEVATEPDGSARVLSWWSTSYARAGLQPADRQHPQLQSIL
jgi:hypothetical protein